LNLTGVHSALPHSDQHQVVARGHGQDSNTRSGHGAAHPEGQGPWTPRIYCAGMVVLVKTPQAGCKITP
jgi:hypothetical protein